MHERVQQILTESCVEYQVISHKDLPVPIQNPQDFARALGYEISRITKTLLLKAKNEEKYCLVVASSDRRIDLNKVAETLQSKRLQMADQQTLTKVLGYPSTGVSPIGAGSIPVLIDEGIMCFPTILIGAGEVAKEIELSPQTLKDLTHAVVLPLTV